MQHVKDSGFPPGTIVTAAALQARWHEYFVSLDDLYVPAGTKYNLCRGVDVAHNFNQGVRKMAGEWVLFLGDDHAFDPFMLMNLLKRNLPVVQPLVITKQLPFRPCLMKGPYKLGMPVYRWDELPKGGLFRLPKDDYTGQAMMLVKKDVLDTMGDPWFLPGQLEPDRLQEDMYFVKRLHDLNVPIYIDCDIPTSHIGHIVVRPTKVDGFDYWVPSFFSGGRTCVIPDLVPEKGCSPMPDIHTDDNGRPLAPGPNSPPRSKGRREYA